ncbi:MAG: aldo/keto reductase [Clostridia bacterium]|nr:aldo/keto reductase [Clostridia bacterium]
MKNLFEIKKLGFGLMRLPKNDEKIDIAETSKMVDAFINAGFTYFDTAYVYGGSEEATKKALVERHPRESYQLASKMAAWAGCESREDAIKQFHTSLERTGAGYFDFYLLHNLGGDRTKVFEEWDLWNWALDRKAEGLIRHLGFSAHCTPEELDDILTAHPEAEFVQLQINYADWDYPTVQSRRCYEVARKHNKPVIVMEPVKGGMLADPPPAVRDLLLNAEPGMSPASWAIRFAASLDGVLTVLSGMSNMEQMNDNLSFMSEFSGLNPRQKEILDEAQAKIAELSIIPCTSCKYCLKVCPMQIGIPGSLGAMNHYTLYGDLEGAKKRIEWSVTEKELKTADQCIFCGRCEKACPQHIKIRDHLLDISKTIK